MAPIAAAQPGDLQLIVIQAAAHAILDAMVEQTPEVAGGEPGLAIQQQRPQLAAMTDEDGGDQHFVMNGAPPDRLGTA